jgi:SNF2 family DNA or RNA helicase
MQYRPHDYQSYATAFIEEHPVSAVFLDCGLGKTIITLTALHSLMLDSFEIHKVLVIAPLRVARDTWKDEVSKWDHLSDLRVSVAVGTEDERLAALKREADIYVINRENVQWLIEESNLPFDYDALVIDELSSFKNHQAKRFKALMKVRRCVRRVIGLTGTPSSNGLMDLWAEFRLLDMGERLGRYIGQYRTAYFTPDRRNAHVVFSYKALPGSEDAIYRKIGDITISMRSTDYLQMPTLVESRCSVRMSDSEAENYDSLKKELVLSLPDGEITAANEASLSGKLCQMANGAIYTDEGGSINIHDRKLDALEDIVEAANGKPLLVAYWFRHDLKRITTRLMAMKVSFQCLDSASSIAKWNRGELQVALIHPASAGHGLNLQAGGSHLVWFGLTWSLELYLQTNARLWRQGQSSSTVVIQHIVTEGTIDERILKALDGKQKTQDALLDAVRAEIGGGYGKE